MTPTTASIQKAARQPNAWPIAVALGTPTRLAAENPSQTKDTARALRSGGTLPAATIAAMPRKEACETAANTLAAMSQP